MPILEPKANRSRLVAILRAICARLLRVGRTSVDRLSSEQQETIGRADPKPEPCHAQAIRLRLAEEMTLLERLDAERERRADPGFGRTIEDRIVWGELIELELEEIDEQGSRIWRAAGQSRRNIDGGKPGFTRGKS